MTSSSKSRSRGSLVRLALPLLVLGACAGCGLAGTAVSAGAGAAAEAQQAQQAKQTEDRVRQELDQAQHAAAQQRADAEDQGK
ncbi:MAG TPA: hypothetical protein VMF03_07725 [Steroidobacteraceae bacterium]|nr:hypothetical protein [Steroidobacteraceae bacterium]